MEPAEEAKEVGEEEEDVGQEYKPPLTELYCDDELSPHLSYLNTHLDLSPLDVPLHLPPLHHQQKVLLPFSVPSILQGSFQETSLDWGED